jgi:hypothetical protein
MNNQIIISGILSVTLFLPTITGEFLTLTPPDAFSQQVMFENLDKDSGGSALDTTNNNSMTGYNIVPISTTTSTNDNSAVTSNNTNGTIPLITVSDVINSTYTIPKQLEEDESERRISRAVRDRVNDVLHTVVASNATIISTATVTNGFVNESININNYTRLLEIIPDQVEVAMAAIRAGLQPADILLELHADIETVCVANDTSLAECNINVRLR